MRRLPVSLFLLSALVLAGCEPDFRDGDAAPSSDEVAWAESAAALADAGTPDAGILPPVRATHPHVFLSSERLSTLSASFPTPTFPARGALQFTLTPRFRAALGVPEMDASGNSIPLNLLDGYATDRNSIFVRHIATWDAPGASPPTVGLQIGMQVDRRQPRYAELAAAGSYVAAARIDVPADVGTAIRIDWDATAHTASVQLGSQSPTVMNWYRLSSGVPVEWSPDGQRFEFRGREGELVTQVQITDKALSTTVSYPAIDLNLHRAWKNLRGSADSYATRLYDQCTVKADPTTCPSPVVLTGATPSHPSHVQDVAEVLALAHVRTGDVRFREAALTYASKLLQVPALEGGEYPMRGRIAAMGLLYDWLYPVMSTTDVRGVTGVSGRYSQRLADAIINTITAKDASGRHPLGEMFCGRQPIDSDTVALKCRETPLMVGWDPVVHASRPTIAPFYLSGHHRGDVAAIALALSAIAYEYPRVRPMLQTAYEHFELGFNPVRDFVGSAGGHQMGWYYGSTNLEATEVFRTAFHWPTPPPAPTFARSQFLFWLYGLRGTPTVSFPKLGDTFAGGWDDAMAVLALYGSHYGPTATAPVGQWLYDEHILPRRSGGGLWDLLLWRPGMARQAPNALPLSRHFGPSGQVLMRENWQFSPTTSLLEFHSAAFASSNHQHQDQNSLSLFYRAPLLVDSGYYDEYGTSHWHNYYIRSVAHNTLTVFDPAEVFFLGSTQWSNDGGQWFFDGKATYPTPEQIRPGGVNALAGVVRYEPGADFTFSVGDASRAYSKAKIAATNGYLRHVLFLRQPGFWSKPVTLVYDSVQVATGKQGLRKSVLWHSVNEPLVNNQLAQGPGVWPVLVAKGAAPVTRVRNGGGMAFLQTLLPAAPSLCKVGGVTANGPDFRFAVSSNPQVCGTASYTNFAPTTAEATMAQDPDVGAWRIEVTDTQGQETAQFLHVISVADEGVTAPPAARRLTADAGTEAVLVGDSLIAVFPQRGIQQSTHGFRVEGAGRQRMIITGLSPNQSYALSITPIINTALSQVTFTPSTTGTYRSTSQGVLTVPAR
ncbi:heparinase II/III family protein [Corallococcus macrosporus]|uniref:Heparinase II/III family protein n=1 Tax=Corallococcus macrosporus TaxID=35 RepID=A0ABS3DMR3_9BACT|nr:heparinase II/III family protein [Corallococcus macrosporus]MBN8232623.1 heparinase II/III family protein [Corallococcus macrosporus]